MAKLTLIHQEASEPNELGLTIGYGMVRFQRESDKGKITEKVFYLPVLWDALRAKKKNSRQKNLIKNAMRQG